MVRGCIWGPLWVLIWKIFEPKVRNYENHVSLPDSVFPFCVLLGAKRSFPDEPPGQSVVVQAISVL